MRRRTPQAWRWPALGVVILVAALGPIGATVAQEAAPPERALPIDNPVEPTGRAVCNLAFTLAGAVGLTSFFVPPGAPLGPNDVIVALRPILDTCVGIFPPAPPRRCFTSDLYPNTGLPITLPDPVGILTEQLEAVADLLTPLGLALSGPLRDLFADALTCRDLLEVPEGGEGPVGPVPDEPAPPTTAVEPGVPQGSPEPDRITPGEVAGPAGGSAVPPRDAPSTSLVSVLPEPLRGAAGVAAVAFAAACALAFRRLLSPRRPASLLDDRSRSHR